MTNTIRRTAPRMTAGLASVALAGIAVLGLGSGAAGAASHAAKRGGTITVLSAGDVDTSIRARRTTRSPTRSRMRRSARCSPTSRGA